MYITDKIPTDRLCIIIICDAFLFCIFSKSCKPKKCN